MTQPPLFGSFDPLPESYHDLDDRCECDDCLGLDEEPAVRPMVTLLPRSEFL